ncbi:autotransporter assembly complex protein TamA [Colwellia psychrerythraea]|uniref:Translocation and assembly module subunit TamA n=1 Tax=Colwellia psychrerythraea TaxID=28229 RepID=A0A099KT26_COLPS|nr:autotransporter assembly complex family protein [Colwellia psychrerythraea]KGJ93656.1 surface antigen (D15) [Colwellia psychrerythraea]
MVLNLTHDSNTLSKIFKIKIKFLAVSLLCLCFTYVAHANNLTVTLDGELPKAVEKNIHSYLGILPKSDLERSAFIYSAKENAFKALNSLGYYQADIRVVVEKEPWELILIIQLNEPTLLDNINVNITGAAQNDPAFIALLHNINIQPGDKLHHGKYETVKSDLLSLALQRGYFDGKLIDSTITIKQDLHEANINISYDSGARYRFGEVNFNDFDLKPQLLSQLIPFEQGDFYNTYDFHKLQQQLQSTQYFSNVQVLPVATSEGSVNNFTMPIKVTLMPAKSHQFDFGVGYATDTKYRLSAGWRTPLINKYGHFQETKIEYSPKNPTGNFIYSIPLGHPTEDSLQFKITVETDEYPDLTSKFYSAQIGRVLSKEDWNRQIYTRVHQEAWVYNLDDVEPNIDWSTKDNVQYIIPGILWSRTIRGGSALDPSSGFRQVYNIEGAHLKAGSDNSFFRVHGRWNYITTLKPKHRLVTRAELGAIYIDRDAELAPSLRFYAGGDQSIRGFAYQSIGSTIPASSDPDNSNEIVVGGTRLMVASIEYQYYLTNKWRMAFFSDGGSVANKGEFNPVYSFGSGIHYLTPVGAVKFDYAFGFDGEKKTKRIHISLGAEL